MIWDPLRSSGAKRVLGEVRRRLFPPQTYTSPPEEFERPPPRDKAAPQRADGRAIGWRAPITTPLPSRTGAKIVALHHSPTGEDWLRVAGARPQFEGHDQPRVPVLGFYASDAATIRRQLALAETYGVDVLAFVVGEEDAGALDTVLAVPALAISFCVAWLGAGGEHALGRLVDGLADPRCLREDGRPVAIVRTDEHAAIVTETAQARGLTPYIVKLGQPTLGPRITVRQSFINREFRGEVLGPRPEQPAIDWPVVSLAYDDEPRRAGAGRVELHDSPRAYRDRLARVLAGAPRFVIVDAWNDWTRGAVLEPDARLGHAYLVATREAQCPPPRSARPVVVVHAYYVELLDEIVRALEVAALDARVIVTTTFEREEAVRARLTALGLAAEVEAYENRGRDILPFLRVANRLLDEGTELVLKLHTKSSGHRRDGSKWRAELIGRLVEPSRARGILRAFENDPALGCVGPEGHYLPLSVYWGWNEDNVRQLCVRMGLPEPDVAQYRFYAGSMFWVRLAALRPLLDAHLGEWEFPAEGGYVDGTIAHAIERALGLAVEGARMKTRTSAAVCGIPFDDDSMFAYAEPTPAREDDR